MRNARLDELQAGIYGGKNMNNLRYVDDPISSVHGILQARILEGLPCTSPGDLPDPGTEPGSPTLQADSLLSEPPGASLKAPICN